MQFFKSTAGRRLPVIKAKSTPKKTLTKLDKYIKATQPELVYFLQSFWNDQQQAVTYKELREASLAGLENKIRQWQDDYAAFINSKLAPVWADAMQAAADDLAARAAQGFFIFDSSDRYVQAAIKQHGAEFLTAVGDETRKAVAALVSRAQDERWSSDNLGRAIRATVGLNKPQAMANANYRAARLAQLIKDHPQTPLAKLEKQADEAALKYAARQHRYRAQLIADTELAWAYNRGYHESVRQAMTQGLMGPCVKIWSTASDERTCVSCGALHNREVGFDDKWGDLQGIVWSSKGEGMTPPAHPGCRCTIIYKETAAPKFTPPTPPPTKDAPDPAAPAVPKDMKLPKGLTYNGPIDLGGTGEMHSYKDAAGVEYLFKPAQAKGSSLSEAFRAYAQEAGYKVQAIVDPDTAVPVGVFDLQPGNGKQKVLGSLQQRIKANDAGIKSLQHNGDKLAKALTKEQIVDLQREHVTDWLLCNFDAHGGNFLMDSQGRLIGIDKEQAFKHALDTKAQKMSLTFHPNAKYGETEPVYNSLFRAFSEGKLTLNPQDTLAFIKRVEAIPDKEYKKIFKKYADSIAKTAKERDALLDAIVARKQGLRETYREFYSDLLTLRTGKKQAFVFADESAAVAKQPLVARAMDPAALKKMNKADLLQMAKQQKIAYCHNMSKAELLQALTDPVAAKQISLQVKNRLKAGGAPAAVPAPKPAAKPKNTVPRVANAGGRKSYDAGSGILDDLSWLQDDIKGVNLWSDSASVEGMNLRIRRMRFDDGSGVVEISGKLSEEGQEKLRQFIKSKGLNPDVIRFENEIADQGRKVFFKNDLIELTHDDVKLMVKRIDMTQQGLGVVEFIDNSIKKNTDIGQAFLGYFRIRLPEEKGRGDNEGAKISALLQRTGLDIIKKTPTKQEMLLLHKRRIAWQNSPADTNFIKNCTEQQLDAVLAKVGITPARAAKMQLETVWDGYSVFMDPQQIKELEKIGVDYVWSGVGSGDGIVAIYKGGGLQSTKERVLNGLNIVGASSDEDIETGGADSVFTRWGCKHHNTTFGRAMFHGDYQVIMKKDILARRDWYTYKGDTYGRTNEDFLKDVRKTGADTIKELNKKFNSNNEVMFRQGIPTDQWQAIYCSNDRRRMELVDKFKKEGIMEINGVPVDNFVKVETRVGY